MKKYIFNKTILAGFIALLLVTNSCTDDFVTISPEYSIDSENFFNSEDDYYQALIGAYDLLQTTYANAIVGEFASNNTLCGGESPTDVIGWQQIDDMIKRVIGEMKQDVLFSERVKYRFVQFEVFVRYRRQLLVQQMLFI